MIQYCFYTGNIFFPATKKLNDFFVKNMRIKELWSSFFGRFFDEINPETLIRTYRQATWKICCIQLLKNIQHFKKSHFLSNFLAFAAQWKLEVTLWVTFWFFYGQIPGLFLQSIPFFTSCSRIFRVNIKKDFPSRDTAFRTSSSYPFWERSNEFFSRLPICLIS